MSCVSVAVTVPTFNVTGMTLGFNIPSIAPGIDFCCKVAIGPWPALPPIPLPLPIPAALFVAVNAALAALQSYVDEVTSYLFIKCPLDDDDE